MNYKINKLANKNIKIEITINKAEWEASLEEAYNKTKGKYKVEGFREGKAPRKVIEKNYGNHVFYDEAISDAFYKSYIEILNKEKSIEPVDAPSLNVKEMTESGVVLEAEVVVKPEVKVTKYKGFNIKAEDKKVADADVTAELKKAQEQNVRFVESKETVVKAGQVVNLDFAGYLNGKAFQGGTATGYDLEIGSKSFIEGFEEQMVGMKLGEEKDLNVSFPANYPQKDLVGKPVVFKVKVNAIKEKQMPELNDEFASNVSDFETLAEYKKDIKAGLEKAAAERAKTELENKIIDEVLKNTEATIPAVMVEHELENIMKDLEYRLMYQGLDLEAYAKFTGTTVDKIKKDRTADAEKSVKVRLALDFIITKEKMSVSEAEYKDKVAELAKQAKKPVKDFEKGLEAQRVSYIKNELLITKLIDFLVANN